jgi:SAM-dependent methyltransferase
LGVRRWVVTAGKLVLGLFPAGVRHAAAVRWRRRFPVDALIAAEQAQDPERLAVLPYCAGRGLDVGCGCAKTTPEAIGVDLIPGGELGRFGSQILRPSAADVCASGDDMPMFADASVDYVVARHNLEHYVDVVKTLREWWRVLKPGAALVVVLPDDEALDTITLDPTHKHAFTRESFRHLLEAIGGWEIERLDICRPNWSFLCVARKTISPRRHRDMENSQGCTG